MSKKVSKKLPRLLQKYNESLASLKQDLGIANVMNLPRLEKIVLNIGQGDAVQNVKNLEGAVKDLTLISGQKPIMTKSKKSIAGFKLREGVPIGCCVTLRGVRMYEFLDRLVNVAIPRIRDFRGYSEKSFDGRGNYSIGIKEHIVFPEIDYDKVDKIRGVEVTFVTNAKDDVKARALLNKFEFPFRKR